MFLMDLEMMSKESVPLSVIMTTISTVLPENSNPLVRIHKLPRPVSCGISLAYSNLNPLSLVQMIAFRHVSSKLLYFMHYFRLNLCNFAEVLILTSFNALKNLIPSEFLPISKILYYLRYFIWSKVCHEYILA